MGVNLRRFKAAQRFLLAAYPVQVGEEVSVVTAEEVGPGDVVWVFHSPMKEAVFLMGRECKKKEEKRKCLHGTQRSRCTQTCEHVKRRHCVASHRLREMTGIDIKTIFRRIFGKENHIHTGIAFPRAPFRWHKPATSIV